jgi:hypothetical protein
LFLAACPDRACCVAGCRYTPGSRGFQLPVRMQLPPCQGDWPSGWRLASGVAVPAPRPVYGTAWQWQAARRRERVQPKPKAPRARCVVRQTALRNLGLRPQVPPPPPPWPMAHGGSGSRGSRQDSGFHGHPGEFRGRKHRPGPYISGHNEGATTCTGARAHPEPCVAKAEPPGHKAREADESGSSRGLPISNPQWSGPRPGGLTLRLRGSWGTEVRGWSSLALGGVG